MKIEITKDITEANCITHAGTFHADEIFATIILSKILPEIIIARVNEIDYKGNDKYIYDVGGGEFDHHQLGGNGQRENGVKYAACGLIWKEFGEKLLQKCEIKEIQYVWKMIDRDFIQYIDANDNGQAPKIVADYKFVHLAQIIGVFNINWDEDTNQDEKFLKAVNIAEIIFDEIMEDIFSKMRAKKFVEKAIENAENQIMILDKFMPWKEFLLESKHANASKINFVVFPSNRGGFNVYTVPKEIGSFENRKSLPKEWAGLRDKELAEVTGVKTAKFCHNECFICTAQTKEDAIKMADIANSK